MGGQGGVEEQGIQVQDNQQERQGAALRDTTELGVTKGIAIADEGCVQGLTV